MSEPTIPVTFDRAPDIDRVVDGFWGYKPLEDLFRDLVKQRFDSGGQEPIRVLVWVEKE